MERDRDKRHVTSGDGWGIYTTPGAAWIKFNSKPDSETLAKLRRVAVWHPDDKAWRAHPDEMATLRDIGGKAQTWESVGEDPPSWADDWDGPPIGSGLDD